MNSFNIDCQRLENGHYSWYGDLDRYSVPWIWQRRESWIPRDRVIIFDLSALTRVDSAGMVMLLHLQQTLSDAKCVVEWRNMPEQLITLLQLSHIDGVFLPNAAASKEG